MTQTATQMKELLPRLTAKGHIWLQAIPLIHPGLQERYRYSMFKSYCIGKVDVAQPARRRDDTSLTLVN